MGSGAAQTSGGTARELRPRGLEMMASDMPGTRAYNGGTRQMPGGRAPGASTVDPVVGEPTLPRVRGSQPPARQVNDRRTNQNAAAHASHLCSTLITPLKAVTWLTGVTR